MLWLVKIKEEKGIRISVIADNKEEAINKAIEKYNKDEDLEIEDELTEITGAFEEEN